MATTKKIEFKCSVENAQKVLGVKEKLLEDKFSEKTFIEDIAESMGFEEIEELKIIITNIDDVWKLYDENGMCVEAEMEFEDYDAAEQFALDCGYEIKD